MICLPHGETNITLHCQNRCVSCNHFIPIQEPFHADPAGIERDLNMAAKVMHFAVYNTVGGEPTLHPQIVDILGIIRKSGICDRVEITSNGQNSDRWPDALFESIDDLIVTPYKITDAEKQSIADRCKQHRVHLEWHWVGFTYAAYREPDVRRGEALYPNCWYAANRNVIDDGYFYRCCIGRFIPEVLLGLPREDDAIALEGLTEDALAAFLRRPTVPAACNVCGSNNARWLGWQEQPDKTRWLQESLQD
jgi:hypothetical protein